MTRNNFGLLLQQCSDCEQAISIISGTQSRLVAYLADSPHDRVVRQQLVECRNSLVASILDEDLDRAESLLNDNIAELHALTESFELHSHAVTTSELLVTEQSVACQLAVYAIRLCA